MKEGNGFSCYLDVGGTFTDCFGIDADGQFFISKAASTPNNVEIGAFNALGRAAEEISLNKRDFLSQVRFIGFGSTIVLNALLTRKGRRCGLLITKGFEDLLLM